MPARFQVPDDKYYVIGVDNLKWGSYRQAMLHTACRHNSVPAAEREFAGTAYGKQGQRIAWRWLVENDYITFAGE